MSTNFNISEADSIKDKCAKACYLYIQDYITEIELLTWLIDCKTEYHDKEIQASVWIQHYLNLIKEKNNVSKQK